MAAYRFTDDYQARYPALQNSILSLLVFADHALSGTAFSGTLDVAASGPALEALGTLIDAAAIPVSGTVAEAGGSLTVALRSTNDAAFTAGVGANIPLIGSGVTKAAWMTIDVIAAAADPPGLPPGTDEIDLNVTLAIGSATLPVVSRIPMTGGFTILRGTFSGASITLGDIGFLLGGNPAQWFPASDLGAYYTSDTALELLALSMVVYIGLGPFSVSISSVSASIGIVAIPLLPPKLYLNPLAVVVIVTDPAGDAQAAYGLEGSVVLCNYARQGDPAHPDFSFDMGLGLTGDGAARTFDLSGRFENPAQLPVTTLLKDLLDPSTDVGLSPSLTLAAFDFEADIVQQTGTLTSFSADIAMSGGFGLFSDFDLESISIAVEYQA